MAFTPIKWDKTKNTPFAQVSVVDGTHGDCNVIDVCQAGDGSDTSKWRRVLIDTGPSMQTRAAIINVLSKVPLPQETTNTQPKLIPKLHEFQVTHIDEDHIGNAPAIIESDEFKDLLKLWKGGLLGTFRCQFVFPHVPFAIPAEGDSLIDKRWKRPLAGFKGAQRDPYNEIILTLRDNYLQWARDMYLFGYQVNFKITPGIQDPAVTINTYQPVMDKYGGRMEAFNAQYPQDCQQRKVDINYTIDLEILDMDEFRQNQTIAFKKTYVNQSVNLVEVKWLAPAGNTTNVGIIQPNPSPLPALPAPPNLTSAYPPISYKRFQPGHQGHAYLAKMGKAVAALIPDHGTTMNALSGMKQSPEGVQIYLNPSEKMYRNFGRFDLYNTYEGMIPNYNPSRDKIATNRSSTVTLFQRRLEDKKLKMLFTADAYDANCDIRSTLLNWETGFPRLIFVDILKIPHHGSAKTVDSTFYDIVRADIYLICGSQSTTAKNPRFATLQAIVRSFENRKRKINLPFQLFFSSFSIDKTVNGNPSPVGQLLNSKDKPRKIDGMVNYQMWKPKTEGRPPRLLFTWNIEDPMEKLQEIGMDWEEMK